MTIPPYLRTGDKVAIVAPAGFVEPEQIASAREIIKSWKLSVILGKNIFSKHYNFSGTDIERASDLQEALDNPEIKSIFCGRGGYGVLRIIDKIDWSGFINNPKWIVGYSDITAIHSCVNNVHNIASIHGPMPVNFEKLIAEQKSLEYLNKIIFGKAITYTIPNANKVTPTEIEGNLIGGNLSLLYSLHGTPFDFDPKDSILFIEDISEYMYHIDRMVQSLKLGSKFKGLKGIVLGGFTEIKENEIPFGYTIKEIITNALNGNAIPIINNFPAGHMTPNYPLIFGSRVKIKIEKEKIEFFQNQCS